MLKIIRNIFTILFFFMTTAHAASQAKPIICEQKYALCTSAPCIPDPRHPGFALCTCDVKEGTSAGYTTCKYRQPKEAADKTTQIISTFSFAQFDTKKALNCTKGMPWTDCVDSPCTINPMNHDQAICSCPVKHTQAFFTFGGDCKTDTCSTGFWSGNTDAAGIILRDAMFKKLNITKNPWPNSACSVTQK